MKKLLLLVLAAALFSGCATKNALPPGEQLSAGYAYVVGNETDTYKDYIPFVLCSDFDKLRFTVPDGITFEPSSYGDYTVIKVQPGIYCIKESLQINGNKVSFKQPIGSVTLEAGKINYIGDIDIDLKVLSSTTSGLPGSFLSPQMTSTVVSPILNVKDNSAAAKESIRKNYPDLAKDLDSTFVYRPVQ